uniref:Uncharacterized protein n=1 Tax=Cacopsylla melanoneura TaxID=428564 RepID=A0A8D9BXT9_9HEMI
MWYQVLGRRVGVTSFRRRHTHICHVDKPHLTMLCAQRPTPVLKRFRHLHVGKGRLDPFEISSFNSNGGSGIFKFQTSTLLIPGVTWISLVVAVKLFLDLNLLSGGW